jgi:hypothetical protein
MAIKKAEQTGIAAVVNDGGESVGTRVLTPEERYQRIAEAAYLRAAAREFAGGDPVQDWLDAEAEINAAAAGSITGSVN